jgi:hypothetical protein
MVRGRYGDRVMERKGEKETGRRGDFAPYLSPTPDKPGCKQWITNPRQPDALICLTSISISTSSRRFKTDVGCWLVVDGVIYLVHITRVERELLFWFHSPNHQPFEDIPPPEEANNNSSG